MMVAAKMKELGTRKSTIREIFEYGRQRAKEVGEENVYDFSLGNPSVPTPDFIRDAAVDILTHSDPMEVHGYTIAPGKPQVREILAQTIRPVEKVEALNAFAGAAYIADDYAGAKTLLMAALEVDPGCDDTIRNMALLLHEMGEKGKALQIAAKMRRADFMLLRALKS